MARPYASLNLPALSIAQWNLWIAAHPRDIAPELACNTRCRARAELGAGLDKALADFDRGLAIKPDGAWSLYGRGLAHLGLGETAPEAKKALP